MAIARILEGQVVEQRSDIALSDVPAHKRTMWKPIEGDPPGYNPHLETLAGPALEIQANRVLRKWTVERRPRAEQLDAVRMEAQRRIIALMGARDFQHCLIKQLNANMRANSLNDKRLLGDGLTSEEQIEAATLRGMETAIQAVRDASNVLEAMETIPLDFASNSRWP